MAYDGKTGSRIKDFRKKNTSYTQADMAEKLHMSTENYAKYERDRTSFQVDMIFDISEILGMPISLMLYDRCEDNAMELSEDEVKLVSLYRSNTDDKKKSMICLLS